MTISMLLSSLPDPGGDLTPLRDQLKAMFENPTPQELALCRCADTFLKRVQQFREGEISPLDFCLSLREIILTAGQVRLPKGLEDATVQYGSTLHLTLQPDGFITCPLRIPNWIRYPDWVKDVYRFTSPYQEEQQEEDQERGPSSGDGLLREHTMFPCYRSLEQKAAVYTALNLPEGQTMLVSLPTGSGKSLVTQMLASATDGLTIVIVPTVALALDQYWSALRNLKRTDGIFCFRGDLSEEERSVIFRAIHSGAARLLFTSPEAVLKNRALNSLLEEEAKYGRLKNLVIDEAHVVPDWGARFRTDFQILSILVKKWRRSSPVRVFLLSATLSNDDVDTLLHLFGSDQGTLQFRCDALRREPMFCIHEVHTIEDQFQTVAEALAKLPKPMVIYVLEPADARNIQKRLMELGYRNIPTFTGDTGDEERSRILLGWKENRYDAVIGTSAFGIGVDKPDVRTIVHACCPENISRFYQEVGRAGRDGLPALSLLVPYRNANDGRADIRRARGIVSKQVLTVEVLVRRWFAMVRHRNTIRDFNAGVFILDTSATPPHMTEEESAHAGAQNAGWNVNLLLFLHRIGFLDLTDAFYEPKDNTFRIEARLLRSDILLNEDPLKEERLKEELREPRREEYDARIEGLNRMRNLIQRENRAERVCWGKQIQTMFPLTRPLCNGCPVHPYGNWLEDEPFRLRNRPELRLASSPRVPQLSRIMGTFEYLIIDRGLREKVTEEELRDLTSIAERCALSAMVVPDHCAPDLNFHGLVLTAREFTALVDTIPALFHDGVLCVLENGRRENTKLWYTLQKLSPFHYTRILCGNPAFQPEGERLPIRDLTDSYIVGTDRFLT